MNSIYVFRPVVRGQKAECALQQPFNARQGNLGKTTFGPSRCFRMPFDVVDSRMTRSGSLIVLVDSYPVSQANYPKMLASVSCTMCASSRLAYVAGRCRSPCLERCHPLLLRCLNLPARTASPSCPNQHRYIWSLPKDQWFLGSHLAFQ